MTDYHWELGIDWDAAIGPANGSYMPAGFVQPGAPSVVKRPRVKGGSGGDTITFFIFDITHSTLQTNQRVASDIVSFTVNPRVGALGQTNDDPLLHLQPVLAKQGDKVASKFFDKPYFCWVSDPVPVNEADAAVVERKFLLSFFVQARGGADNVLRTFAHDPEMIVGPNM